MKITSWDANTFLCLVSWGLPEDLVKGMMKMTKKTHEDFSLKEALGYWNTNSPRLVRWRLTQPLERRGVSFKFQMGETLDFPVARILVFKRRNSMTIEFKKEWRMRSIEDRQKKVVEWCKFGSEDDQMRHQRRLSNFSGIRCAGESRTEWLKKSTGLSKVREEYTKNLWASWGAGASAWASHYLVGWYRRVNISRWYEGIHPGRFFLFYKENKIIEERNGGFKKGPCEDGYGYPKTPIFDWGPYEQLIEDLRCIDGPGLGESGSNVEHIDDLFLD